jgi:hypothetical protein
VLPYRITFKNKSSFDPWTDHLNIQNRNDLNCQRWLLYEKYTMVVGTLIMRDHNHVFYLPSSCKHGIKSRSHLWCWTSTLIHHRREWAIWVALVANVEKTKGWGHLKFFCAPSIVIKFCQMNNLYMASQLPTLKFKKHEKITY